MRSGVGRGARFDSLKFRLDLRCQFLGAEGARQRNGFLAGLAIGDGGAFAGVVNGNARIGKLLAVGFLLVAANNQQIGLHGNDGLGIQAGHARGNDGQVVYPVRILDRRGRLRDRHGLDAAANENLQSRIGKADDALGHLVEHQRLALTFLKIARVV